MCGGTFSCVFTVIFYGLVVDMYVHVHVFLCVLCVCGQMFTAKRIPTKFVERGSCRCCSVVVRATSTAFTSCLVWWSGCVVRGCLGRMCTDQCFWRCVPVCVCVCVCVYMYMYVYVYVYIYMRMYMCMLCAYVCVCVVVVCFFLFHAYILFLKPTNNKQTTLCLICPCINLLIRYIARMRMWQSTLSLRWAGTMRCVTLGRGVGDGGGGGDGDGDV